MRQPVVAAGAINGLDGLAYDPAGRLTQILFPNGIASDYAYDIATGRLTDLTHNLVAVPQLDFDYGYNAVGNISSIVQPSETRSFGYDDLQRLVSGGTAGTPECYAYDEEGNRTSSHLSASHTTDIANRLSDDDAFCYVYDLNGNLTTKTAKVVGACTGDITSYSYDAQDQLVQIDFPGGGLVSYRYDDHTMSWPSRTQEKRPYHAFKLRGLTWVSVLTTSEQTSWARSPKPRPPELNLDHL